MCMCSVDFPCLPTSALSLTPIPGCHVVQHVTGVASAVTHGVAGAAGAVIDTLAGGGPSSSGGADARIGAPARQAASQPVNFTKQWRHSVLCCNWPHQAYLHASVLHLNDPAGALRRARSVPTPPLGGAGLDGAGSVDAAAAAAGGGGALLVLPRERSG